ncbi:MAG: hypothetical protein ACPL4I_11120, partial [Bacteroidota bacterium]
MSLSAKRVRCTRAKRKDFQINLEADQEIRFFEGLGKPLTQKEADAIAEYRDHRVKIGSYYGAANEISSWWRKLTPGARYIAAHILAGSEPDLSGLAQKWTARKSIRRELSAEELASIGASVSRLAEIGIRSCREARAFYELYRHVRAPNRSWGSTLQVDKKKVVAIACTPNYRRLPVWVKKTLNLSAFHVPDDGRVGNIWRLCDCAKAWKHAPLLPKGIAEKVGKLSPKARILAFWAWEAVRIEHHTVVGGFRRQHKDGWRSPNGDRIDRAEVVNCFWIELKRLSQKPFPDLLAERQRNGGFTLLDHNLLRQLAEHVMHLPTGQIFAAWGQQRHSSLQRYLQAIAATASPQKFCQEFFGSAGKATLRAFRSASQDSWLWAVFLCDRNPDAAQKILSQSQIIGFEPEAIEFLRSLPVSTRLRLLTATTFRYRGEERPLPQDYVRDTGYLWGNLQQKPELGRVRCWFTVHEQLSAAFVANLPDEDLPIPTGWERVDGLSAIDRSWQLELPKRVETLRLWGE